jgi:hypothetical protein
MVVETDFARGRQIDDTAMEDRARYTIRTRHIIRASFSQERMQHLDQEGKVVYAVPNGKSVKGFPVLEWLAAMCSHIPNRGEQMMRCHGCDSNVSRGKRRKEGINDAAPCILEARGMKSATPRDKGNLF